MWAERAKESAAMMMIGDGLLSLLEPQRHCMLWKAGPRFWESIMEPFVEHPNMARVMGAAELAMGFWLASRQSALEPPPVSMQRMRSKARSAARQVAGAMR